MGRLWVNDFSKVIGKRIQGLIVARHLESPERQVFLIFDDATHYELFGSDLQGCKGIDPGGFNEIRDHIHSRPGVEILLECNLE
jgi:hypothetical protein